MGKKSWSYITVRAPGNASAKVKVDTEDLKKVSTRSWRVVRSLTGRAKVVTSVRTEKGVRSVTLGRFLMKPPKGKQVYPRRFNESLDYRKENLIVCTVQERQRLLPKNRKATSSRYRGVSYSQKDGKWRAGIEVAGRAKNLGHYKTEEEAAQVYNQAAMKYFGSGAYQNRVGRRRVKRSG